MNRACSMCGITYFHIRAEDGILECHNGHVMHAWNGYQMLPVML